MFNKFFLVASIALLVLGCEKRVPTEIDYGQIDNRLYRNDYFNMTVKIPENWVVQSQATQKDLMNLGKELIAGEDEGLKNILKLSEQNQINLFVFLKYEMGSPVPFNPSIASLADKVAQYPGIKRGSDYLYHVKNSLKASPMNFDFPDDIYTRPVSNISFDIMPAILTIGEKTVKQEYYAARIKDYVLGMVLTYTSEEELAELLEIVNNISFSPGN